MGSVQGSKGNFVRLADLLELLDVATSSSEIHLSNLERRPNDTCELGQTGGRRNHPPKFGNLSLELLLTRHVFVCARGHAASAACPTLIDSELLLVALELPCQLLNALFKVLLAGLGGNEGLACLAKLLGLRATECE